MGSHPGALAGRVYAPTKLLYVFLWRTKAAVRFYGASKIVTLFVQCKIYTIRQQFRAVIVLHESHKTAARNTQLHSLERKE
jgi:hypothetical protein